VVDVPDGFAQAFFIEKDSKRFPNSAGWGYALFNYDAASDMFTPDASPDNCGHQCHTIVKAKDYIFHPYQERLTVGGDGMSGKPELAGQTDKELLAALDVISRAMRAPPRQREKSSRRSLLCKYQESACGSLKLLGETSMAETVNETRRRMLAATAMTIVGSQFTRAIAADTPAGSAKSSFGPLKQVDAGLLNMGYAEAGPAGGRPVILLHGWPYDIYSFVDVASLLA